MKCAIITHAGPEWTPPAQLDENIRSRIETTKPDRIISLYSRNKYEIDGAEHHKSIGGELEGTLLGIIPRYENIEIMGLYHNQCHLESFKDVVHSLKREKKESTIVIPTNCVVKDAPFLLQKGDQKTLMSEEFNPNLWRSYDREASLMDYSRSIDLRGPDMIYSLSPKL